MAAKARMEIRIIRIAAYILFWVALVGGALGWLSTVAGAMAIFGFGAAIMGSLTALAAWLGAVGGAGILVMLVEMQRSLAGKK